MFEYFLYLFYTILTLTSILLLYLYFAQNKLIYMPEGIKKLILVKKLCTKDIKHNPKGFRDPSESGMEYEEVFVKTKDNLKLFGWFIKQIDPHLFPTIVYFHENLGSRLN